MLAWIRIDPQRRFGAFSPADWRRFATARFRPYHVLAFCQGVVMVLAGFDVIIPFALELGAPPALAMLLGAMPVAGGMAQVLVPRLLDATDGNLRQLTVLIATGGEMRGLVLAALAVAVATGLLAGGPAIVVLALIVTLTGVLGAMGTANLLAWHSAVLAEQDRRLVVPRLMAVSMAVGAVLLLPVGLVLDHLADAVGLLAYAAPFGIAGVFGLIEIAALRRLPHPGRVIVPPPVVDAAVPESPELRQLLRASATNALGMGIAPYLSVYAIAVLGLSPGFTMALGALGLLSVVAAAAVAGARLAHGSSARFLRTSFAIRAIAMALPILALPGSPFAPALLCLSAILASVGFATGQLAANERLFRLIRGPAVIRHHGRYLARTSAGMASGQLVSGTVLAVGAPLGYGVFATLFAASSCLRAVAFGVAAPAPPPSVSRPAEALPATPPLGGAG